MRQREYDNYLWDVETLRREEPYETDQPGPGRWRLSKSECDVVVREQEAIEAWRKTPEAREAYRRECERLRAQFGELGEMYIREHLWKIYEPDLWKLNQAHKDMIETFERVGNEPIVREAAE